MILLRWACLALFALAAAGCGSSGTGQEPDAQAKRQMIDKIERLKAKSAQKPAR